MFSFPLYERLKAESPEFEEVAAFQAGGARLSVRRAGRGRGCQAAAVRVRHRQLLLDARRRRVRRPGAARRPTTSRRRRPVAVLSHHAWQGVYGADPSVVGSTFVLERASVHRDRHRAAGVLRRNVAERSAGYLASAAAGAADRRRQLAAAAIGLGVAARHRPAAAGRHDRRHGSAPHRRAAPMDAARLRLPVQLDARRDPHASASR